MPMTLSSFIDVRPPAAAGWLTAGATRLTDAVRTHAAIEKLVGQVLDAGALPIILGGDHSITEPDIRAIATRGGPVGLIHFDTHTDTGREVFGATLSHGSCMYRLVESGHVDPERYVQIGLRGYWPGETEFAWQHEQCVDDRTKVAVGAVHFIEGNCHIFPRSRLFFQAMRDSA